MVLLLRFLLNHSRGIISNHLQATQERGRFDYGRLFNEWDCSIGRFGFYHCSHRFTLVVLCISFDV